MFSPELLFNDIIVDIVHIIVRENVSRKDCSSRKLCARYVHRGMHFHSIVLVRVYAEFQQRHQMESNKGFINVLPSHTRSRLWSSARKSRLLVAQATWKQHCINKQFRFNRVQNRNQLNSYNYKTYKLLLLCFICLFICMSCTISRLLCLSIICVWVDFSL